MTKRIQLDRKECDRLTSLDDQKLLSELTERTLDLVGGALTAETMGHLSADQITLIAYYMMRGEVLEGGFIQLIHNGYGPFIFENPLAKALNQWGLRDLRNKLYDVRRLYEKTKDGLTGDCSDSEFMALYEKYERYDDYDDDFVECEPEYTSQIASYLREHINNFVLLTDTDAGDKQ